MGGLGMKKRFWLLLAGFWIGGLADDAPAQNIVMKDGKVITARSLRRQGETIIATVTLPGGEAGKPAKTGDLGFPLAQIARLDFPEPTIFKTAADLITQGKGADVIAQLDPVVKYYEGFRDAPGSWWADAALLKAQALASIGREKEAEPLAEQIARMATDPETVRGAEVMLASGLVRRGAHARAMEVAERALKECKRPATLAPAAIIKGECLLEKKEWEDAMLAFLQVPVLYPGEKMLLPQSLLGKGRAQFGMENLTEAKAALNELIKTYAASSEAAQAKTELEKITRREKALAPPK
jgi:hypothetical protein